MARRLIARDGVMWSSAPVKRTEQWVRIRSDFAHLDLSLRSTVRQTRGQSVMLTTLLVIVASITAGMIVNRVHPECRNRDDGDQAAIVA